MCWGMGEIKSDMGDVGKCRGMRRRVHWVSEEGVRK